MISMISLSTFGAVLLSQSHLHPVCYRLSCCPLEVPSRPPPPQACTNSRVPTATVKVKVCLSVLAHSPD